jgi:phytoene dehydrogenase-like protein
VRRVVVRDGRAAGVELEDGTEVPARAVVSGAHPQTIYLDLVGRSTSPRRWSGTSAGTGPGRAR